MARALKPSVKLPAKLSGNLHKPHMPHLPDPNEPDVFEEMTLLEHMEELRDRIVKTCIGIGVTFIVGLFLAVPLLHYMKNAANAERGFQVLSPTEPLTLYMKVALYIAIAIAMPLIVWQFIGFLAPGLTNKEKRILLSSLPFVTVLFFLGAAYAFFVAAPKALWFLSNLFTDLIDWSPQGDEVVNFYLTLMVGIGLAFELPVIMFLLAKLGVVTPAKMKQFRKYAFLAIIVIAAVITPTTDPFNLSLVAIPLVVLYEIGVWTSYFFVKRSTRDRSNPPPAAAA
ncbi:MAG TPA: twin-arginine translocase subunit TatC [Thermomicrobiales bacterium]|nr:twin-arginine translocase subunit TatC [Thermomicrobiales bacterium]